MIKRILYILMAVIIASQVTADICTVMGEIRLEDGSPAPRGTLVNVTDLNQSVSYLTSTGGTDWPMENFFVRTFTCEFYDSVSIETGGHFVEFTFDNYPYEINLTANSDLIKMKSVEKVIKPKEKEPQVEKPILITTGEYMHDVMRPEEKDSFEWYLIFLLGLFVGLLVIVSYKLLSS